MLARMFHVAEVAAVLTGWNFQRALKDGAHRVDVSEAALARDRFHTVLTFFETAPRCFDSQALNEFRRRRFHFGGEDAGKIPRTHRDALCEHRHRQRFVQIIEHPRFQFAQRFPIGGLKRKRSAELRLAAGPAQIKNKITRDLQCEPRTVIFFDQGEREVHSRGHTSRGVNVFVADKNRIRIDIGARRTVD